MLGRFLTPSLQSIVDRRTPRKELDASTGSPKEERLSDAFDALKSEATTSNADSDEEKDQMAPMMKVFRTPTKIVEPIKTGRKSTIASSILLWKD